MKKFFSKYFEYILIVLTILFLFLKPNMRSYGERISMIFLHPFPFIIWHQEFCFLDKLRVGSIMRLMYLFGLWSVSITVIAVMCRTY
ncbi:MAG: hypothetical protein IPH42_21640 [Bacteroidetes bacterium]|nr:hypothetical protein [Bacteroidota bacterium]